MLLPSPSRTKSRIKHSLIRLFSESNSRFVVEVSPENQAAFEALLDVVPCVQIGRVTDNPQLVIDNGPERLVDATIDELKQAWQSPLNWK